jgi:hypothetical protein
MTTWKLSFTLIVAAAILAFSTICVEVEASPVHYPHPLKQSSTHKTVEWEATLQQAIERCMIEPTSTFKRSLKLKGAASTPKSIEAIVSCVMEEALGVAFTPEVLHLASSWSKNTMKEKKAAVHKLAVALLTKLLSTENILHAAETLLRTQLSTADSLTLRQHLMSGRVEAELAPTVTDLLARRLVTEHFTAEREKTYSDGNWPYYRLIPDYKGSAVANANDTPLQFKTECFREINVTAKYVNDDLHLEYVANEQTGLLCIDLLLFSGAGKLKFGILFGDETSGKHVAIEPKPRTGNHFMLRTYGASVFSFTTIGELLVSTLSTLSLFLGPMTTHHPNFADSMNNALFQNAYTTLIPALTPIQGNSSSSSGSGPNGGGAPRTIEGVGNGDLLMVSRLDGQDTIIAWLMGSNAAHVALVTCPSTVPECLVCETRFQALWWPDNGVECHRLSTWLEWAYNGSLLVTHLPATDSTRQLVDAAAIVSFVGANHRIDYGYQTAVWAWVDVLREGNFPCYPDDFQSHCMSWQHLELLYLFLDDLAPSFSEFFGGGAFGQRVGLGYGAGVSQAFEVASKQYGWTPIELAIQPELDNYTYWTIKNGDSYIGRVFTDAGLVCNLLRQGTGPLSGQQFAEGNLHCAEQTVWNIVRLNLWNATQAKQVLGDYTLLPMSDAGTVAPYAEMGNSCPSKPPHYTRPHNC